jgi:hypothetical protein
MKSVFKAFKEKKYADIAFGFMFLCSIVGIILVCVGLDISEREAKEAKKLELESSNGK